MKTTKSHRHTVRKLDRANWEPMPVEVLPGSRFDGTTIKLHVVFDEDRQGFTVIQEHFLLISAPQPALEP